MTELPAARPLKKKTLQRTDKGYSRAFTTEPKIRRVIWHKQQTVKTRATVMQESFYPTTDVHYNAAKQRMATLLGIVDDQSVLAYLGRPETVAKNRVSQTVRYHSGAVVNKNHTFIRRLPAKKGYIEIFGLGHVYFKNDEWRIHWNHSEQSTLPLSYQSEQQHCFYYQGERDGGKVSKEDISLPNIGIGNKQAKLMETHTETIEKEKRECI